MFSIKRRFNTFSVAVLAVLATIVVAEPAVSGAFSPVTAEERLAQNAPTQPEPPAPPEDQSRRAPPRSAFVVLPRLTGLSLADVEKMLRALGLHLLIANPRSTRSDATVVRQQPPAGARLRPGDAVTVMLSSAPNQTLVAPDLVGLTLAEAETRAKSFNLSVRPGSGPADPTAQVVSQAPLSGKPIRTGSVITVTLTLADEMVVVPAIVGKRVDAAERDVAALKLDLKVEPRSETATELAEIASQDPPPGRRVRQGSTVTATIIVPPTTVIVPSIVGLKIAAAKQRLGPSLMLDEPSPGREWPAAATVASQSPEPGTRVPVGSPVSVGIEAPSQPAPTPKPAPQPTPEPQRSPVGTQPNPTPSPVPEPWWRVPSWLWAVGALAVALLALGMRALRRRRSPPPVHVSLHKDAGRGRVVIEREGTASPIISIRCGHGPVVTHVRLRSLESR